MHTLLQDLRYATRQLIRNLGLTITAVVSLALGIGATTAVFSVIYATLMNPYPYPTAARIVRLTVFSKANSSDGINLNGPQIKQLQQLHSVEGVLAMDYDAMNLTGHDLPQNVNAISLISNGFHDLGVPPIVGRGLSPSDAPDGQEPQPVVVLSYKFWQKHFFGDRTVLGQTLQLDQKDYVIVGVAAPRFTWYSGLALTVGLNKIVGQWADGNAHDPIVLLAGTLLLGLVAGIACAIPARRASRVDPMTALRCD